MYYPLSQITSNLNTNGGEFAYADTEQEYKGYYWATSSGKYYTGKTPQDVPTQELIKLSFKGDIGEAVLDGPSPELTIDNFVTKVDTIQNNEVYLSLKEVDLNAIIKSPLYSATLPTQQDYQNTEFRRYFCKKSNEIIYLEISKETYDKLIAQDPQILFELYTPFDLPWQLTGNREQVYKTNKNITELASVRQKLPMLSEYLKMDFTKYYK
jgi:hypothetical protein